MGEYCIKDGYISRKKGTVCDLSSQIEDGSAGQLQREVYQTLANLCPSSVLDIGCGSGYKLIEFFECVDTLGLEVEPNLSACKRDFPNRNWALADYKPVGYFEGVICADVIEHVLDPDVIMKFIKDILPRYIVFSTPDRLLLPEYWRADNGPPFNTSHIREWTTAEFLNYCHKWLPDYKIKHNTTPLTITVTLTKG